MKSFPRPSHCWCDVSDSAGGRQIKGGKNPEVNLSQELDSPRSRCQKFFLVGFMLENSLQLAEALLGARAQTDVLDLSLQTGAES